MPMRITPPATLRVSAKHPARRMIGMSKWNCSNCSHVGAETTHDVACCNCCDDGEFYDPIDAEEDDPFHENDPYVVTHPMAFY
jgi:hypothetical protein